MKRIKLYISLLFIIGSHYGMGQCMQNGDFADWCEIQSNGCSTFTNTCVTNWQKSHGTPEIFVGATPAQNVMYMWAQDGNYGEGVFAGFNFLANHQYTIRVAASKTGSSGSLVVLAANGVSARNDNNLDCGGGLPNVSGTYILMNQSLTSTMTEYTTTFTPTSNYSQVWIYPSTQGTQIGVSVDYVFVCPDTCTGTIIYNSGSLPGGTTRAGFIYAGSSSGFGGSGTVTVQNGITTSLIGGDDIILQPSFHASLTSGEFRAVIYACYPWQGRTQPAPSRYPSVVAQKDPAGLSAVRRTVARVDSSMARGKPLSLQQGMVLYPNPARNKLGIELALASGNISGIQVTNALGVLIRQVDRQAYVERQRLEIDVSDLPNGLYTIRVITDKGTYTEKFQKLK